MFRKIFGEGRSIHRLSLLFGSPLQEDCIEFFEKEATKMIVTGRANIRKKMDMLKYVGLLREAAQRGRLTNFALTRLAND